MYFAGKQKRGEQKKKREHWEKITTSKRHDLYGAHRKIQKETRKQTHPEQICSSKLNMNKMRHTKVKNKNFGSIYIQQYLYYKGGKREGV